MNPQKRKYYAVLVHHGASRRTERALVSLNAYPLPPSEIIVVDHADQPFRHRAPEKGIVKKDTPAWLVIRPEKNRGFAAGVNVALGALLSRGATESDIVVVMNNDVIIQPETFTELRHWWQTHPAAAILGVVTEEEHGSVMGFGYVNLLSGRTDFHRPHSFAMPYIHGSFFAAPYGVLMKMHGLAEKYFLYWEDAELGVRAARENIPLAVSHNTKVKHQREPDVQKEANQKYYLVRNGALFLENETSLAWRKAWWLRNRLRLVYHLLRPHSDPIVRQALIDACRGVTGAKPSVA